MKSFSKFVPSEHVQSFETWDPKSLEFEDKETSNAKVQEILAIFNGPLAGQSAQHHPGHSNYIKADASVQSFDAWNPEEISWVPPFPMNRWEWEEIAPSEAPDVHKAETEPKQPALNPDEEIAVILASARAQAEEIILNAQKHAEEALQEAQEDILRTKQEGYDQGWQQAKTEAATVLQAAQQVVVELSQWREEMLAKSENTVITIIRDVARFMFGEGVKLDETGLQMNLGRVLENAKSLGDVRIFLNPSDALRLDPAWKEYQSMLSGNKVVIVPSDGIKPGGCFVQGETGSIDARVEAQLDTVLGVFNQELEAEHD
jgi:flagellar biosynthesis/type III secretory pathway protein FliH